MTVLAQWHKTTFAEFQRANPDDRSDWHVWCGLPVGTVIDLGCGASKLPGAVGIDLAFGDVHADCLSLPFPDNSIDVITTSHLIEHVDPVGLLYECARILKPTGRLLIEGPNLCGIARALRVWHAGGRDARYPCGAKTRAAAILRGILAYRHLLRIDYRELCLDVSYPGKDPDAVWWCNYFSTALLLRIYGFSIIRATGYFHHTFRIEVIR